MEILRSSYSGPSQFSVVSDQRTTANFKGWPYITLQKIFWSLHGFVVCISKTEFSVRIILLLSLNRLFRVQTHSEAHHFYYSDHRARGYLSVQLSSVAAYLHSAPFDSVIFTTAIFFSSQKSFRWCLRCFCPRNSITDVFLPDPIAFCNLTDLTKAMSLNWFWACNIGARIELLHSLIWKFFGITSVWGWKMGWAYLFILDSVTMVVQ